MAHVARGIAVADACQRRIERGRDGRVGAFGTMARSHGFQRAPDLIDLLRDVGIKRRDDRPLPDLGADEPLGFQVAQNLADNGAADAKLFAQIALDQPIPRLEDALEDRLAQVVKRELTQGLGGSLDLHARFCGLGFHARSSLRRPCTFQGNTECQIQRHPVQ